MDDLIKRQDAIDACFNGKCANIYDCKEAIEKIPSAQKTGKWIVNSPVTMKCDQCGYVMADWKCKESNYCPHCGCRMVGEEE